MGSKAEKKLGQPRFLGGLGASKWVRKLKKLEKHCFFNGFGASKRVRKLKKLENIGFSMVLVVPQAGSGFLEGARAPRRRT